MSSTCPECEMEFSRRDAMLRHKRNKHGTTHPYPQSSDAYPPPPPPPPMTPPPTPPPPKHHHYHHHHWHHQHQHHQHQHHHHWPHHQHHHHWHPHDHHHHSRHRRLQMDIRRRSSNTHRVMKKNLIIFWKPTILTHFTFPINTIPIISCRGSIRLPVWLQDLQAVDLNNLALEYLSDLIPPTVSEISENYLHKSKYRSTNK